MQVPLDDTPLPSRYVVGIDLGTTNSAVSYVDTEERPRRLHTLPIPQVVDVAMVAPRDTLPSFHYEPAAEEFPPGALRLPWSSEPPRYAVGEFARDQGRLAPGRLIASAKSWLCHSGVDRTAALLPWRGAADVQRLSPIAVSARYLQHLRAAWDARFPPYPLAEQDLILTLPASFDEVARELTVQAAASAGLRRVILIEEPQAAFYAWIERHQSDWEQRVAPGQKILVCDIGGGTTDFTLICVRTSEEGKVQFHRVAVGDHLILGGDNFDLALAHDVERRWGGAKLEPRAWETLVRLCQRAKEILLGPQAPDSYTLHLPGGGSRLLAGGRSIELARDEVGQLLVEGFFPGVALADRPQGRRSGFQEFGLPYATDPAITRYLAAFLTAHRSLLAPETPEGVDPARPDFLLFNGGVFESPLLQERLVAVLRSWFTTPAEPSWSPVLLQNPRLDLAVSQGAAYYGLVRRGEGVRIAASLARTYYLGVEGEPPRAVCLVPATAEPGQEIRLTQRQFDLLISEPVEFPLYVSSTRLADQPGEIQGVDPEQMTSLPPIRTVLRAQNRRERGHVAVELQARLTEIGTLELWCAEVGKARRWRLQFDVRAATETDRQATATAGEQAGVVEEQLWGRVRQVLQATFGPAAEENPDTLMKRLTAAAGMERRDWPMTLLRQIWEALRELEAGRRKSTLHEARWLNLLGFALRPGYGLAVDDWRVAETWRTVQGRLAFAAPSSRTESLILWRRLAGGLSAGQQQALAEPLLTPLRALHRRLKTGQGRAGDQPLSAHEMTEVWRLLGSLEWLPVEIKGELGDLAMDLLPKKKAESFRPALCWALGRLGQRIPVYGPLNTVVSADRTRSWRQALLALADPSPVVAFALMQLSRRSGDRHRDLPESERSHVLDWLQSHAAPAHFQTLVQEGGELEAEEQSTVFGESLPKGLRIA